VAREPTHDDDDLRAIYRTAHASAIEKPGAATRGRALRTAALADIAPLHSIPLRRRHHGATTSFATAGSPRYMPLLRQSRSG